MKKDIFKKFCRHCNKETCDKVPLFPAKPRGSEQEHIQTAALMYRSPRLFRHIAMIMLAVLILSMSACISGKFKQRIMQEAGKKASNSSAIMVIIMPPRDANIKTPALNE